MSRPFAVGDMVVSKSFGVCYVQAITENVIKVKSIDNDCLFFGTDGSFMEFEIQPDIVAIRTPRKGCKEAREMVFVSACYYRAKLNKRFRHLVIMGYTKKDAFESSKECAQNSVEFDIYDEQKSMLGANNA